MKRITYIFYILIFFIFTVQSCRQRDSNQKQQEIQISKIAAEEYKSALKQAAENNPEGLLKLYKIASDDLTYTVEYSEVAGEDLIHFLYSKTELWIRTFSKVELSEFKTYLGKTGLGVSELPEGVTSDGQLKQIIVDNIKKIKGDEKETELIDYILKLIKEKQ